MFKISSNTPPAPMMRPQLVPDVYTSTVISVEPAPGYAEGQAEKVTYELVNQSGAHYPYHEIFRTAYPVGDRSKAFFDYLDDNGITEWEDFVGCQEVLTLQFEYVRGRRYLNITDRHFIYEAEEADSDASVE